MRVQKCSPLNRKRTCSSTSSSAASLCRPSNPTPSRPTTTTSSSCTHPRTSTSRSCWTSRPSSSRLSTARRDRIVTYLSSPSMLILPLPSPLSPLLLTIHPLLRSSPLCLMRLRQNRVPKEEGKDEFNRVREGRGHARQAQL